jgi:hypothetical protein
MLDQVEISHPMSIMVLMQSSGKYDIHCRMFSSERAASASLNGTTTGAAVSVSAGSSMKADIRVVDSTDLLPFR